MIILNLIQNYKRNGDIMTSGLDNGFYRKESLNSKKGSA